MLDAVRPFWGTVRPLAHARGGEEACNPPVQRMAARSNRIALTHNVDGRDNPGHDSRRPDAHNAGADTPRVRAAPRRDQSGRDQCADIQRHGRVDRVGQCVEAEGTCHELL